MKRLLVLTVLLLGIAVVFVGCGAKSDSAAVEDTIRGYISAYNSGDYEKCVSYFDNLSEEERSAMLSELEQSGGSSEEITIESIDNITVSDSIATATVKMTWAGDTETSEISLVKKDGEWKLSTEDVGPANNLQAANAEIYNAKTAVAACMAEANKWTLTLHAAWNGTAGKVTATADDLSTIDAASFLNDAFRATYTFDVDGNLVSATLTPAPGNTAWTGIKWDHSTLSWVQA
ncbi:MAG: nuclear transport factor 2 family protein [Chloroflexi bacterium]|nr:nuclear transport factor 2 family protein [Chloroflexota bacterium]